MIDFEEREVLWDESLPGTDLTLPMFSPDGRSVSMPSVMGRGRDAIWIFDTMTGARRVGVRFPERFRMAFRADWVDDGEALVVNRYEPTSHVVLYDDFWSDGDVADHPQLRQEAGN